jgi:hypothetical protein
MAVATSRRRYCPLYCAPCDGIGTMGSKTAGRRFVNWCFDETLDETPSWFLVFIVLFSVGGAVVVLLTIY